MSWWCDVSLTGKKRICQINTNQFTLLETLFFFILIFFVDRVKVKAGKMKNKRRKMHDEQQWNTIKDEEAKIKI